jgi:hypothetical protein
MKRKLVKSDDGEQLQTGVRQYTSGYLFSITRPLFLGQCARPHNTPCGELAEFKSAASDGEFTLASNRAIAGVQAFVCRCRRAGNIH